MLSTEENETIKQVRYIYIYIRKEDTREAYLAYLFKYMSNYHEALTL